MRMEQNGFRLRQEMAPPQGRKRWGGCLLKLPCFGSNKNIKRVVPSSRTPNSSSNPTNMHQNNILATNATNISPSLFAPPSSPASFSNSGIPSLVQSPNYILSSPERTTGTIFATGPYAHETQLVSPPVFSNFTTEPSTAPFTPPPEFSHLTTPSSPDVPYAQFLLSSTEVMEKNKTFARNEFGESNSPYAESPGFYGCVSDYSNFFCLATFAQYYQDNPPNFGGRISVSKESDVYCNGAQNRQNNICKQDGDEVEAYRASFGFSADEITTTPHHVEINDVNNESLTIWSTANGSHGAVCDDGLGSGDSFEGHKSWRKLPNISVKSTPGNYNLNTEDNIFSWKGSSRSSRKYYMGLSSSDAEIDYRRGRSLSEYKTNSEWHD